MLDQAPPGQRLDITWLDKVAHDGWMPNLPWALMHRLPAQAGQPVDAREFLGLRFRIDYATHGSQLKSRALGDIGSTYRAFGLYWGAQPGDETTAAAKWQASGLARFQHQVFVPEASGDAKPKLVRLLGTPGPAPMRVLYLYCQTDSTSPTTPQLRFGSGRQSGDLLSLPEIGLQPFSEAPLVFLNACVSSGATAYATNAFQSLFLQRGCSAYIGSETKVPIQFASRFAAVFFRFLYRDVDRQHQPIAAGEAFAQTRLFFWTHFRNIGGLLYNYVNEYDLFMASEKSWNNGNRLSDGADGFCRGPPIVSSSGSSQIVALPSWLPGRGSSLSMPLMARPPSHVLAPGRRQSANLFFSLMGSLLKSDTLGASGGSTCAPGLDELRCGGRPTDVQQHIVP